MKFVIITRKNDWVHTGFVVDEDHGHMVALVFNYQERETNGGPADWQVSSGPLKAEDIDETFMLWQEQEL